MSDRHGSTKRLLATAAALAAPAILLGGCSGGGKGEAEPACSKVWQPGNVLPKTYNGCAQPNGTLIASSYRTCANGRKLVPYQDRMWAYIGGRIHSAQGNLADDPLFKRATRNC